MQYTIASRGGVEDTRLEAKAKDTKKFRGQGQGPTTQTQVFCKKKGSSNFFFRRSQKKGLQKFFSEEKGPQKNSLRRSLLEETKKRSLQIFRKVSSVFQRNFSGLKIELSSAEDRANFEDLRLRGQGLQNVSSRPRTYSRNPPLIAS